MDGYAAYAALIANDRDRTTAVYRRFHRLTSRNLLILESEMQEIEEQQNGYDLEDSAARNDPDVLQRARLLPQSNPENNERYELSRRSRKVIKEYRKAMKSMQSISADVQR